MSLNVDMNAAAWAVGSLALGGITGSVLDRLMTYTIDHRMHDMHPLTRCTIRVALQGGVGVVLLGSVVRALIPDGTETPIGDAMLYFAFLHAQPKMLSDLLAIEHYVVHMVMGELPSHKHPTPEPEPGSPDASPSNFAPSNAMGASRHYNSADLQIK